MHVLNKRYILQFSKNLLEYYIKQTKFIQKLFGSMNVLQGLENSLPKTTKLIKIVGLIVMIKKILKFIIFLHKTILRKRINLKKKYGSNSWAFITGSSQGIGKAFAFSLAKQGFNIILSARTLSKLQKTKSELSQKFPSVEIQILVVDYKRASEEGYLSQQIQKIKQKDISILINNVGVDVLNYYSQLRQTDIEDLIKINCFPMALLNRIFIQRFQDRFRKIAKKSAIVNVSSLAAQIPMPLHNVYSASKAFIDILSRALSYQYQNIDIISLKPSQVSTAMTMNKQTDILTITAQDCSEGLLNDLGHDKVSYGFWSHGLQGHLYSMLPQWLFNYIWKNYIGPQFMDERKKSKQRKQLISQKQK